MPFTPQLMEMASPELASALLVGLYLVSLAQWDGNKKEGHGVRDGDQSLSPCRAGKPHGRGHWSVNASKFYRLGFPVLCSWEEWMEPEASGNRKSAMIRWPTVEGK